MACTNRRLGSVGRAGRGSDDSGLAAVAADGAKVAVPCVRRVACDNVLVPYHVCIWPRSDEQQRLGELYAFNLTEEQLRERFVRPYDDGSPITWGGRTLLAGDHLTITISETAEPRQPGSGEFAELELVRSGNDVTNDWITGAPAATRTAQDSPVRSSDPERVMVVYGRNAAARNAMFTFLRSLGLRPIEWEEAIRAVGEGSPHNLDTVRAAMTVAQAVVVVLTAEDHAGLLPELASEHDQDDVQLRGQPRQNVILEAGLAMGVDPERTILVELGPVRRASDFDGLNVVRITNDSLTRHALRQRLKTAGCSVAESGGDWLGSGSGGDFDSAVVSWQPAAAAGRGSVTPVLLGGGRYQPSPALEANIDRFLDMWGQIDQPFGTRAFADEVGLSLGTAEQVIQHLAAEHRVRDAGGGDWYPVADPAPLRSTAPNSPQVGSESTAPAPDYLTVRPSVNLTIDGRHVAPGDPITVDITDPEIVGMLAGQLLVRDDRPTLLLASSAPHLRRNHLVFPLSNTTKHPALNAYLHWGLLKSRPQTVLPDMTVEFELAMPHANMAEGVDVGVNYADVYGRDWQTIFTVTIAGGQITATTTVG